MFANTARILISAIVLLFAVILSPLVYQAQEPAAAPQWSLRVMQTPKRVSVGDKLTVEIALLRNGLPGQMAQAQPLLSVLDEAGMPQNLDRPVLAVTKAVRGEATARTQRWLAEYVAVRPGPVRIQAMVTGIVAGETGDTQTLTVVAQGESTAIEVGVPSMASKSGTLATPLYFGGIASLLALGSLLVYRRTRLRHL